MAFSEPRATSIRVHRAGRLIVTWNADVGYNDYGKAFADHSVSFTPTPGRHVFKFTNSGAGMMLLDNVRLSSVAATRKPRK